MKSTILSLVLLSIVTTISAQQWQNATHTGYTYFSSGSFINKNEGWILARNPSPPQNNYFLLHTIDGAHSFEPIFTFPENLVCWHLQMVDSLTGFAKIENIAGYGDYFWKTTDGGYNWQDITDTTLFNKYGPLRGCNGFYFVNKDTGCFGGENSSYRTQDGGINWLKMNTPTIIDTNSSNNYKVNSMFFVDDKFGWAACSLLIDAGFVLKTTDGGINWTTCDPITGDLYNIHFADSLHGGTVGGSWYYSFVILTNNNFDTISHFYMNEWNQLPSSIYYQNDSTIWMSGFPAIIYRSTNGGDLFVEYDTTYATDLMTADIHDFQFFGNTGYAFSYSFLLKYNDTLNSAIPEPVIIKTDILISPNPLTDIGKITVSMEKPDVSDIEIYSSNGMLVQRSAKQLHAGKNEVLLDVKNLDPGLYLIILKTSSCKYSVKFIKQP